MRQLIGQPVSLIMGHAGQGIAMPSIGLAAVLAKLPVYVISSVVRRCELGAEVFVCTASERLPTANQ